MTYELENIILTIDTHEEANKPEKTRIKAIEDWFTSQGAIVEHEELALCDYVLVGKFRGFPVNIGSEYKTMDNFLRDSIEDMEDKLTRSMEIYDTVALFIEAGNYTFKPNPDNCHCVLDYSGATKASMKQNSNGNPEPQSKTLAAFEGFCDTLQSNGIHVRQLRSEAQFPYSVYNLLVYQTKPHRLKIKTMTYEAWLLNHFLDLPTIGIVKAKKLILRYPNPFWIASASEESLVSVLGKVTGRVVYQHLRSHELETNDWKNNYFKDGQDIIQCSYLHRSCNQVNAYNCVGKICEHHPDYSNFSEKIKAAIVDYLTEEYPHALSVDELCNHFNIEQGDTDKELFLVYLKELAWERKITNTVTGEFQVVHSHSANANDMRQQLSSINCLIFGCKVDEEHANDMRQQPKGLSDFTHNSLQSQCDPTEGTNFFLTPLHSVPSVDDIDNDNDKSTGVVLPPLISPVPFLPSSSTEQSEKRPRKKLSTHDISNHSGSTSFSTPQPRDTQDVPSPNLPIQRPDVQGTGLNQVLTPTLDMPVPATTKKPQKQKKDLKLASSKIELLTPSSAITPDEELFGKPRHDWKIIDEEELKLRKQENEAFEKWNENIQKNLNNSKSKKLDDHKMSIRPQLETYLQNPHTLQECVDHLSNFGKGSVWEHIARMKKEGIVIEFDNKTLILKKENKF